MKCLCGNEKGGPFGKDSWWQIYGALYHCQKCNRLILVLNESGGICAFFRPEAEIPELPIVHYAIICSYPEVGQVGCTWGTSEADAMSNVEDKRDTVKRMAQENCKVCNERA